MENQEVVLNVWTVVSGVVMLLLSGAFIGVAGFAALARTIRNDPALIKAIEGLTVSVPADRLKVVNQFGQGLEEVGRLVVEATDEIPADSKPKS
jgi:hypothetical protein